ncbi:MAG: DUF6293 family protein [Halodesulfurarchaeum sp.]|nr:DUF6293 family protein [Halodesulfurarchaeum sp.]
MPVGFEEDRIFKVAEDLKADKVVLIANRGDSDDARKHLEKAKQKLIDMGYDPLVKECDIFDLYESLGLIANIIAQFSDDEVYVNVSTGSKVTAIAGMIAAMMTGANAYYARAKEYRSDDVPRGIDTIFQLPNYPIESPEKKHVLVLKYLEKNGEIDVTKSDLIDFAENSGLKFISDKDVSRKAKYRLLDNHIISPLLNRGYIRIEEKGRNRLVSISNDGRDFVEAFGFMSKTYEENEKSAITAR